MKKIHVVIWNEFRHEKKSELVRECYPNGIHGLLKEVLEVSENLDITLATLDDPHQGLPDEVLNKTDVLIWWAHTAHQEVDDELVKKIQKRVYEGKMGFVALHSAHASKPFTALIGSNGHLTWGRDQKEIIWNMMPSHPIAAGIPENFHLECEELYSEPFYIGKPDDLIFGGWYEDGNIFRSGVTFTRGAGKIFYFQPGHEKCKSLYDPHVQKIIRNAVYWVKPNEIGYDIPENFPKQLTPPIDAFEN